MEDHISHVRNSVMVAPSALVLTSLPAGLSWMLHVLSLTARVASPGNNEAPCPRSLRILQAIAATAVGCSLLSVPTGTA